MKRFFALALAVAAFGGAATASTTGDQIIGAEIIGAEISKKIVATWQCQDQTGAARTPAKPSPWALKHRSEVFKADLLNTWILALKECRVELREVRRQWNWQAWLPAQWQRIGACETGYGQKPGNWHHDSGEFQGAFGFRYTSWDDFKLPGYPNEAYQATPWQQYQVALAIYNRYGLSGWGCKG